MIHSVKEYMEEILIILKTSIALFLYWSFDVIYIFLAQFATDKNNFHENIMNAKDLVGLLLSIVLLLIAVLKLYKLYKNRNK